MARGRLEKSLTAFFTIVVIIGCAFEHIADNRISDLVAQEEVAAEAEIVASRAAAQQAGLKTAEIEADVAPRDFSSDEKSRIASFLKPFKGRSALVLSYSSDPEGYRFAAVINRQLSSAGIKTSGGYWYPDTSSKKALLLGLEIWAPPEQKDFANSLQGAFSHTKAGVRYRWFPFPKGTSVTIHVGVKPFPTSGLFPGAQ